MKDGLLMCKSSYSRYVAILFFVAIIIDLFAQRNSASIELDSSMSGEQFYEAALKMETKGDYLAAVKNYTYSLLVNQEADSTLIGRCYNNLSDLYWRNGNNPKALETGIKAIDIFEKLSNSDMQVLASHKVVQIYISEGELEKAEMLRKGVEILAESSYSNLNIAESKRLEGVIFFYKGQYLKSIAHYKQALSLHQNDKNNLEVSVDLSNIGESYDRLSQVDSALHYYAKSIAIQREENFGSGLIFTYYSMGNVYKKNKEYAKATTYYNRSVALMNSISERREMPYVFGLMAELFAELGDYEKAFTYQLRKEVINDSITLMEKSKRFDELKGAYQIEKAWKENEFLRKENNLKNEQLLNNNRIIRLQKVVLMFIVLGLILSIIYTIVFFNNQRRLKRANSTRDKLFSIIAHDLRGPIGSAKSLTELLLDYDPLKDAEKVKQYLLLMSDSLGSTYNLLEELLAWAKAQSEHLNFNPIKMDLKSIADSAINHLEHAWSQKEINIENGLDNEPIVYVDNTMITTVIRNLLSNAVKFSHPQGKIEIIGTIKGLYFEVCVRDYGVGISDSKLNEIFDPNSFYTTYGTKNEKGTGLGLILCKEFVKQNGGSIHVESKLAKGSSFIFTVPLASV